MTDVPRVVQCDLVLPVAGGDREGRPIDVSDHVRELGGDALRLPVTGASQLILETADEGHCRPRGWSSRRRVDGEGVGRRVEAEGHGVAVGHGEGDVGAIGDAAFAIVLVPGLRDGGLALVRAGGNGVGRERVHVVAIGILQPGGETAGVPVSGTAELGLEATGSRDDPIVRAVGDPVGDMRVVDRDIGDSADGERNVARRVADVPGVVQCDLVLPVAGGNGERRLPHVADEVAQLGVGTGGIPVTGAPELGLERSCNGDRTRRRKVVGHDGGRERANQHRNGQYEMDDRPRRRPSNSMSLHDSLSVRTPPRTLSKIGSG